MKVSRDGVGCHLAKMNGRTLRTRLARLECRMIPRRPPRIVVRFEGPGSERFRQPTQEEMDECRVMVVRFVKSATAQACGNESQT